MRPKLLTCPAHPQHTLAYLGGHGSIGEELRHELEALGYFCADHSFAPMRRMLLMAISGGLRLGRDVKLFKATLPLPIYEIRFSFLCSQEILMGRIFCAELSPCKIALLGVFVKPSLGDLDTIRSIQNAAAERAANNLRRTLDSGHTLL